LIANASLRNLEIESGAAARLALSPDPASHAFNRLAHDCQTDTGAPIVTVGFQAFEDLKDLLMMLHVEANAIIANPQQPIGLTRARSHLDLWRRDRTGEFDSIVQTVSQRLRQRARIDDRGAAFDVDGQFDGACLEFVSAFADQLFDETRHFDAAAC